MTDYLYEMFSEGIPTFIRFFIKVFMALEKVKNSLFKTPKFANLLNCPQMFILASSYFLSQNHIKRIYY